MSGGGKRKPAAKSYKWKASKSDPTQPDGKPICRACAAQATYGGRFIDQTPAGDTSFERSVRQSWGAWVSMFSCDEHLMQVRDEYGLLDITFIGKKTPQKKSQSDQEAFPW